MNLSLKRALRASLVTFALAAPLAVSADQTSYSNGREQPFYQVANSSPLVDKVRRATARYRDINVALNELPEHWVRATPCVSGPNEGAMGVHLLKPSRLDGFLNGDEPEALIYEPLPNGSFRLVGVEFIVKVADWVAAHPNGPATPDVDGHLTNLVTEPNRFGLPSFYELHVWAWEHNPKGSFADWNTQVTCEKQAAE